MNYANSIYCARRGIYNTVINLVYTHESCQQWEQCIARCYLHLLPFGQQNMCLYSNICGYMHIIRFLPQENESQCASLVCTPDRQERQTTKLIENIKCSESVNPKHQSSICRKSSSVLRANNVNFWHF